MADDDTTLEETSVVYERVLRAQEDATRSGADAFEIVAPVGRGGMGEVLRAVQRSLGREVALKRLLTDSPAAVEHFLSEARVTARLAHANIIPVHTLDRGDDGRPLLAMKLVKGTSWQELIRRRERDLSGHLQIFLSVCNAVAYAHAQGFLHRDLKPANVMVADYGQVFVLDWGLAVGLDRDICDRHNILHVKDARTPAGTPAYMAPELAAGDGAAQGPWTDVYLLGGCLHEVVTGAAPHGGADTAAALARAERSPPPSYGEDVPRELADICRAAMARAPEDRYPDVGALIKAVEAFRSHSAARTLTDKGLTALARLREQTEEHGRADEGARLDVARSIHRTYSEARFAFEHALEIWPEDEEARRGLGEVLKVMLSHAIDAEDVALSARLSAEVEDAELRARAEELRARTAAREAELRSLREQAKLLDDTRVARPLGRVFVLAGVIGGAATVPTSMLLKGGLSGVLAAKSGQVAPAAYLVFVLWTAIAAVTGLYAARVLGRAKRSLVSPRVGWTWAGVGVGCLSAGVCATMQGHKPFENVTYTTTMIAIGFVAMAMQTRLWLLVPAGLTFLGAILMASFPAWRVEIFGALWVITLIGVGVALRRGVGMRGEVEPMSMVASQLPPR